MNVVRRDWGDYSSDEEPAINEAITSEHSKSAVMEKHVPTDSDHVPRRSNENHIPYPSRSNKNDVHPRCSNENRVYPRTSKSTENRAQTYARRLERVYQLVLTTPWQNRETYFQQLVIEEGHCHHIPTLQYVHSILFTLMNQEKKIQSRWEESVILWGPIERSE